MKGKEYAKYHSQISAVKIKFCEFSLALVFASSSAFADCPENDIPYSAEGIAFSERVNPILATVFKANLPGWILVYNPTYSKTKKFSYCEFEKRPKDNPTAFSDSDIAEIDQMIDEERLQQLIVGPMPDAASAKAQFDAHVAQIRSRPTARSGQEASADGEEAATPQAPTKPKKPKLVLPGSLPCGQGI